jgi:Xaa-Pro dipeptidase
MKNRIKNIFENVSDIDTIVIKNNITPHHDLMFFYITGIKDGLFNNSIAVINRDLEMEVITTPLEADTAKEGGLNVTVYEKPDDMKKILKDRLSDSKKIGINGSELVYDDYMLLHDLLPEVQIENVSEGLNLSRAVKDQKEIESIRKACDIVSKIATEIPGRFSDSTTEHDISSFILTEMLKAGSSGPAFETDCSFGANTALPHYHTGHVKVKEGDFVLTDFGAIKNRYVSDITRTWFYKKADSEAKKIYETVLEAQLTALDMIKPGIKGAEIHDAASKVIEKAGYKGKFTHSTGHGIGLNVHDANLRIHIDVDIILKEGMVFTVEPGIYILNYGGVRIEDDVVVTGNGCETLTSANKELVII